MEAYKAHRIPKLKITNIGSFDKNGSAIGWCFDGKNTPNSVTHFISGNLHLIGGYTMSELKKIKILSEETQKP